MKLKRITSFFIAMLVLAFAFPAQALMDGEGGAADEYVISTADELWEFAEAVNGGAASASAVLTANIDVSDSIWTSIGSPNAPYTGTFDGSGYAVTYAIPTSGGDAPTGGLFGALGDGAVIRNLTVEGSTCGAYYNSGFYSEGGLTGAGGIAAMAAGGTILNCVNKAAVTGQYSGGIVGWVKGPTVIENCVNYGTVSAAFNYAGGIVGVIGGEAAGTSVTGCVNYGTVASGSSSATSAGCGGIVGQLAGAGTVERCANLGAVTGAIQNYASTPPYGFGGIVGRKTAGTVNACYNAGAVAGALYVGGIVGCDGSRAAVTNCYNTARVNASAYIQLGAYAGGILGYNGSTAAVTNCFNIGEVTSDGSDPCGIVGRLGWGSVDNCYYLDSRAADPNAEAVSAEGLLTLAEPLGDAYQAGPGHPLLTWQEVGETGVRTVRFSVIPVTANVEVTDSTGCVLEPDSSDSGVYTYKLRQGEAYTYSVSAEGYYRVEAQMPEDRLSVTVTLEEDKRVSADEGIIYGDQNPGQPNTIVSGGTYQIGAGAAGVVTVETTEPVTLSGTAENLCVNCTVAGVSLTLKNVTITNTETAANMFHFIGAQNYLYFEGENILDLLTGTSGYALIHVPTGVELTLGGVGDDDTLYLYKTEQGAGIGGNGGNGTSLTPEYNGKITFTQGRFFMKGTKQGALIGAGASANEAQGAAGDIVIEGGMLTLLANAGGAAIGGSAGETAAKGANVYIKGGTITINVDFSGAAIGGGGYKAGQSRPNNNAEGGNVYYSGGSIRTFVNENAMDAFEVTEPGVNGNVAITADIWNADEKALYLCELDMEKLGVDGGSYQIYDGDKLVYSGGLHLYSYVNESRGKNDQVHITDTTSNWASCDDTSLYVYLTGETHRLSINGVWYIAEWDEGEKGFAVYPADAQRLSAPVLSGEAVVTIHSVTLTPPGPSAQEEAAVPEYRVSADGGRTWSEWQASPVFTGLKANTEYSFQARYRAVDEALYASSMSSDPITVKTPVDPNIFQCEAAAYGSRVTAAVSGTSLADFVDGSGVLTADLVTGGSGITQVTAGISGATLAAMTEEGVYAFALETDLGLLRFDARAVSAIARGGDAVLTVTRTGNARYSFRLTVDGASVTRLGGGTLYLELPYTRQDTTKSVLAYDDANQNLKAEYQPRTERVTLTVSRLSDIIIQEAAQGDPYASVWDGLSLDVSWFTPGRSSYYISTPAQLMGLAALVNGIYNDEITTIVGDAGYIVDHVSTSSASGGSNESTDTYHYGSYDFNGATVYLTADLDMGGSSGANYMPIGGEYLMAKDDTSTKISSSFCGVLDGGGHTVSNIYCDRCCSGNYGDGSSVGLIGRLGVHDNDPVSLRPAGAAVRNVAVDGYFYANRSVGGVVGKIGKSSGGVTIESCANFATVVSTDTKGCGGIVGAAWNGGVIRNCYNAGTVQSRYPNPTGGIAGSNEVALENCYNVGSISSGSASFAMAIGTNNGGASYNSYVINCWYLEGSAPGGGYYSGGTAYNGSALTSNYMKTPEFAAALGSAFAMDTAKINNGYPVLSWQEQAKAGAVIKSTTTVKNGVAATTVAEDDVSASVATAIKNKYNTLYIITDTGGKSAAETVVEVPKSSVKAIADAQLSLSVETADGSRVTMTSGLLSSIAGKAAGRAVALTVTPETSAYTKNLLDKISGYENTRLEHSATVKIGISSGGVEINGFTASVSIEIPVDSGNFHSGETYDVLQILSDGTVNRLSGKCVSDSGQLYICFTASRLGTFTVLDSPAILYDDVLPGDWFYDAVMYVTNLGLMNGMGGNKFDPDGTTTRAMLVTVLYRMEKEPAVTGADLFVDVAENQWYTDAVNWAGAGKIVEGYGNGNFGPEDTVTREQIAAILYRYMQYRGLDVSVKGSISQFRDGGNISDWAYEGVQWAVGAGIMIGDENKALNAGGEATRAEIATMIRRLVDLMEK